MQERRAAGAPAAANSSDVRQLPVRRVGPVPFRVAPFERAVDALLATNVSADGCAVHFANAYTIALAASDDDYARLLGDPRAAVFTDGVPVAWIGRRGYPDVAAGWQRVYGPDVMAAVFDRCHAGGLDVRHFLLGSTPETLARLERAITTRWPKVQIVGSESPPFGTTTAAERTARDDRIREARPAMVWVGLGTPKQDHEVVRLAAAIPAMFLAVGAAFDFIAGTKPQAPVWMQRSGTEWAFRLATEPKRLTRRYLWGNPRFLVAAAQTPGLRRRPR